MFANVRAFGDVPQAIEIDIGTTIDGHQRLIAQAFALHVTFESREANRPSRFGNGPGVFIDILDPGTNFVGGHGQHFVNTLLDNPERLRANLFDGHAVGENADVIQRTRWRAWSDACIEAASSGSTPITLIRGHNDFT